MLFPHWLRNSVARLRRRGQSPARQSIRHIPCDVGREIQQLERLTMLSMPGSLDTSFSGDGKVTTSVGGGDSANDVVIQDDGKILVVGTDAGATNSNLLLIRYLADGSLDATFNGTGISSVDFSGNHESGHGVELQSDGRIVVAGGLGSSIAVYRLNTNGSLDTSFSVDGVSASFPGIATDVALQTDGRIVAAGVNGNDIVVVRHLANGNLDTDFDSDGLASIPMGNIVEGVVGVAVQTDGKIVVAGNSNEDIAVLRLNSNGSLDTGFDSDGIAIVSLGNIERARSVVIQPDGKIVVSGSAVPGGSGADFIVARLNTNGSLDTSFNSVGTVTAAISSVNDESYAVALQPNGRIVAVGYAVDATRFGVVRYNANGSLDTTFDSDGVVTTEFVAGDHRAFGVAIQRDGKIVVAGVNSGNIAVARYFGDGLDFGDAPDSGTGTGSNNYNTLSTDNGPSHTVIPGLRLGATVDGEYEVTANATANGDDVALDPDDEDGLNNPLADLTLTIGAVPTLNVFVTNTTGSAATLYGWIDYNANGVFETSERTSVAVASGSNNDIKTLLFPTVPAGFTGKTYARFRLSTDSAAQDPTGSASDGEVEDYVATITKPSDGTVASFVKIASEVGNGPALTDTDFFGYAVEAIGDLNQDGVTDLAVGVPHDGDNNLGAVYVFFMAANGTVSETKKLHSLAVGFNAGFGNSIAAVGDLDGDGVTEIVVGATEDNAGGSTSGAIFVLFLNSDGTVKRSQKINSGNGNGPATISSGHRFGSAVTSVGDLDGDGVTDIAAAAFGDGRGAVYLLFMNSDGTVKSNVRIADGTTNLPAMNGANAFGHDIANLGDLNGDTITDIAVGDAGDDTGGTNRGSVFVLFLNRDGTLQSGSKTITSGGNGGPTLVDREQFGSALEAVGDLNGDGVTDLAVGSIQQDGNGGGHVRLLMMNSDGTVSSNKTIGSGIGGGPTLANLDYFGKAVAFLGDLNGDGVSDIAVGSQLDDQGGTDRGAVYVLFLKPVNQAPSIMSNGGGNSASINVAENTTAVTTVTATDPDAGTTLVFSKAGGADAALFSIDSSSGVLTFASGRDAENKTDSNNDGIYEISVQVSDGSLTDTQTINVTITDVNDVMPVVTAGQSFNVAENSAATTAVGTVLATDGDVTATTFQNWMITAGNTDKDSDGNLPFAINTSTGAITVNDAGDLDREQTANFTLSVTVSDGTNTSAAQTVTVTVSAGNDNNPAFTSANSVNVPENTTAVLTVTATDADLPAQSLTFSLDSGADQAKFSITSGGVLTFQAGPNFESPTDANGDNVYVVVVKADDGNGGTSTQTINVTVTDIDDTSPPVPVVVTLPTAGGPFTVLRVGGNLYVRKADNSEVIAPVSIASILSLQINGSNLAETVNFDVSLAGALTGRSVKVVGNAGADKLDGSAVDFAVFLDGGNENDTLLGGSSADTLGGGSGSDSLVGGAGDDVYLFVAPTAAETDTLTELANSGTDRLDFAGVTTAVTANLGSDTALATHTNRTVKTAATGQAANFENVTGGGGADVINGNSANNRLEGGLGNDTLKGFAGDDELMGGAGNDNLQGGVNNDVFLFAAAVGTEADLVTELSGEGTDRFDFSAIAAGVNVTVNLTSDTALASHSGRTIKTTAVGLAANFENVTGGAGHDSLTGSASGNVLLGGAGNDSLIGGAGNDSLAGGLGDDAYIFTSAASAEIDSLTELPNEGADRLDFAALAAAVPVTVDLGSDPSLAIHTNRTVATATGQSGNFENATGGAGNDTLTGNTGNNTLDGGAGTDNVIGGLGADKLIGGAGNDSLSGGVGDDTYAFLAATAAETDTLTELSGEGADQLDFSGLAASVTVLGNLGNDAELAKHTNRVVKTNSGQSANFENFTGGAGNDSLTGNSANNRLDGGLGIDVVQGGNGNDSLIGGGGNDSLRGGADDDVYLFMAAPGVETDILTENFGEGTDRLDFGGITVAVTVNLGSDTALAVHLNRTIKTAAAGQALNFEDVTGGTGNDVLNGNGVNNWLDGGNGNDSLNGGAGNDSLIGGMGDDGFVFLAATTPETDVLAELPNQGVDRLDFTGLTAATAVTVDLRSDDALASHANRLVRAAAIGQSDNFERVTGGAGNDAITGNSANNNIDGGAGNDTIDGAGGHDTLIGGAGNDVLAGGIGDDVYSFLATSTAETDTLTELPGEGSDLLDFSGLAATVAATVNLGSDTALATHANRTLKTAAAGQSLNLENVTGGAGADSLTGNSIANRLTGGLGNDSMFGLEAGDVLLGGDGNDSLDGGADGDSLNGQGGNDIVLGGTGSDSLTGDAGNDRIEGGSEADRLIEIANLNMTLTATQMTGGLGTDTVSQIESALLVSGSGNNALSAATFPGAVTLIGDAGNDTLTGGNSADSIDGGDGGDSLTGNGGNDTLLGGADNDKLFGLGDHDSLDAGSGNDSVMGGDGNDHAHGGNGLDTLDGGNGNDCLHGDGDADRLLGQAGNDTLHGGAANDTLDGGVDDSTTAPGSIGDVILGEDGNDSLLGGLGNDVLVGGIGNDTITGNDGRDTALGGVGTDSLLGGNGDDLLIGNEERDTINGETGTDSLGGSAVEDSLPSAAGDVIDANFSFDFSTLLGDCP